MSYNDYPDLWDDGNSFEGDSNARYNDRGDGFSDILYGGSNDNTPGDGHGHVVFDNDSGSVSYWRDAGMDHDDYGIDNLQDDHTRW